jgi:hypothetical protein
MCRVEDVPCGAPGIGEEKSKKELTNGHSSSYLATGSVAPERAVMDLHISDKTNKNSSTLEVACGPPGIYKSFR